MKNRKIDKKTMQVCIDIGIHQLLKLEATSRSMSIKELLEGYIADGLRKDEEEKSGNK